MRAQPPDASRREPGGSELAADGADEAPEPHGAHHAPAGHRRPAAALIGLAIVAVQALFVFCLSYPPLHASPHGVPIGVAGPATALHQITAPLAAQGTAFEVHVYGSAAAARTGIENRAVYGAIVVTVGGPRLLVASAANPTVAGLLRSTASRLGGDRTIAVTDVVPAASRDPEGVGALTTLLPLVLLSVALGVVLAFVERRPRRLPVWCVAASAVSGLAVSGVAAGLGTFPGSYWANAGVLGLLVLGLCGTSAGLSAVALLRPLAGLVALTMLFLGIPSAGATVPPALLPQPWRAFGPYLPPGAAVDALRGLTFFGGAAVGGPLAVLTCWALIGLILVVAVPLRGSAH